MKKIGIIDNFNDSVKIDEVYERVTGYKVGSKSNCKCPFHKSSKDNYNNAGIDTKKKNSFSCFSHKCATGMKAYEFIAKYHNLENEKFPAIAKKINEYYPNSFKIYSKENNSIFDEKKECVLSNFYLKIETELREKINERIQGLNNFFFDKQGIQVDINKMKNLWDYVKVNEYYYTVSNYIKIDGNIGSFKINEERLKAELTNRVLKFRDNQFKPNITKEQLIEVGRRISDEYKKNPSEELKESLERYRFEYRLLHRDYIEINNNNLSTKEKFIISCKAGLNYLETKNVNDILRANKLYDLNKQLCSVISEQEKDVFICGNIDYTVSMINVTHFNNNYKRLEEKHITYLENELQNFRKKTGSKSTDKYFCDKAINLNKKLFNNALKTNIDI